MSILSYNPPLDVTSIALDVGTRVGVDSIKVKELDTKLLANHAITSAGYTFAENSIDRMIGGSSVDPTYKEQMKLLARYFGKSMIMYGSHYIYPNGQKSITETMKDEIWYTLGNYVVSYVKP